MLEMALALWGPATGTAVAVSDVHPAFSVGLPAPVRLQPSRRPKPLIARASSSSGAASSSSFAAFAAAAGVGAVAAVASRAPIRRRARRSVSVVGRGRQTCCLVAPGSGSQVMPSDEEVLDTVVVGAGISGLCVAYGLTKETSDAKVAITEARDAIGGNIITRTENGRLWEEGPNSYTPGDTILGMACDLGLKEDILLADPKSYRYVWLDGKLRALPAGLADAVFGDFMSLRGKFRAFLGALGLKRPMPKHEESLRDFVTRNLGEEAFANLIDPFVSGVYAGDPAKLSAEAAFGRAHALEKKGGSLLGGARQLKRERSRANLGKKRDPRLPEVKGQTVGTFRQGMRQFVDALASRVMEADTPVRLNWKLRELSWDSIREEHLLKYDTPDGPRWLRSRSLVMTAPAYITSHLLRPLSASAADALEEIRYPSVAVVTTEYPKSAFREPEHGKGPVNGFGQLHPRSQGIRTLGTIYSSSLFPSREPDVDKVMLVNFIGGDQDPTLFGGIDGLSEDELVETAHRDAVRTMLKPSAADELPKVLSIKVWPRAIPQWEIGHFERLERARDGLIAAGVKGIFLAGNYVGGVALGSCVEYGLQVAEQVAEFVKEPAPQLSQQV